MKMISVLCCPDYVLPKPNDNDFDDLHRLSEYDRRDVNVLTEYFVAATMNTSIVKNDYPKAFAKLSNLYYEPGEFVFDDDCITMDGKKVIEILPVNLQENEVSSDYASYEQYTVALLCHTGCMNHIVDNNMAKRKAVADWLIEYLFKRLERTDVVKTQFFKDYWLQY